MKAGIVGAGIMGQLLAFSLLKKGWQVSLFDQNDKNSNCSYVAAGLLTPVTELENNELIIHKLGMESIKQHWPAILNQLNHQIDFRTNGCVALAHPRDKADLLRWIHVIENKLSKKNYCHRMDKNNIQTLEPELTKFDEGYFFSEEGHIDNQEFISVLSAELSSIPWYTNTRVEKTAPGKIYLKNSVKKFDLVFDCRGLGAKSIYSTLRGVRGELIWLHAPEVNISRPIRLLHPRYRLYIVPRRNNFYLLGASEIESEENSEISVRTTLELLTAAYYIHPGFAEARIIKTATQCRPTLLNHLPKIKYSDGYIAINGLYRHGFLIAPSLMMEVMRWLEGGISSIHYFSLWEQCHDNNSL